MTNKEILKRKIIYRSKHRGTKEMDFILGSFVEKHIDKLSETELEDLKKILVIDDEILSSWYFQKKDNDLISHNKISQMLKDFKL